MQTKREMLVEAGKVIAMMIVGVVVLFFTFNVYGQGGGVQDTSVIPSPLVDDTAVSVQERGGWVVGVRCRCLGGERSPLT